MRFLKQARGLWLIGLLIVLGCESGTGSVTGIVRYRGEKVPSGTISFLSQGKVAEAEIKEGRYRVKGVPVGEARITVVRLDPTQPDPLETVKNARKQESEIKTCNGPAPLPTPSQVEALQLKRHLLPSQYASLETTDLNCTVTSGENSCDITLHDRTPPK